VTVDFHALRLHEKGGDAEMRFFASLFAKFFGFGGTQEWY